MSDRILLDTDVVVDFLHEYAPTLRFFDVHLHPSQYAISVFTYGELYDGVIWGKNPERAQQELESFLAKSDIAILPISQETMRMFARLRGHLRTSGNMIGTGDLLIAATAVELDLVLITRNVRHFNRIPDLRIIDPSNADSSHSEAP